MFAVWDFLSGKRLRGEEALKGISSCDVGSSGEVSAAGQSGFRLSTEELCRSSSLLLRLKVALNAC